MGRPAHQRQRIERRAAEMLTSDGRVNKSRIARELHCHISTVFRVLPGVSLRLSGTPFSGPHSAKT